MVIRCLAVTNTTIRVSISASTVGGGGKDHDCDLRHLFMKLIRGVWRVVGLCVHLLFIWNYMTTILHIVKSKLKP